MEPDVYPSAERKTEVRPPALQASAPPPLRRPVEVEQAMDFHMSFPSAVSVARVLPLPRSDFTAATMTGGSERIPCRVLRPGAASHAAHAANTAALRALDRMDVLLHAASTSLRPSMKVDHSSRWRTPERTKSTKAKHNDTVQEVLKSPRRVGSRSDPVLSVSVAVTVPHPAGPNHTPYSVPYTITSPPSSRTCEGGFPARTSPLWESPAIAAAGRTTASPTLNGRRERNPRAGGKTSTAWVDSSEDDSDPLSPFPPRQPTTIGEEEGEGSVVRDKSPSCAAVPPPMPAVSHPIPATPPITRADIAETLSCSPSSADSASPLHSMASPTSIYSYASGNPPRERRSFTAIPRHVHASENDGSSSLNSLPSPLMRSEDSRPQSRTAEMVETPQHVRRDSCSNSQVCPEGRQHPVFMEKNSQLRCPNCEVTCGDPPDRIPEANQTMAAGQGLADQLPILASTYGRSNAMQHPCLGSTEAWGNVPNLYTTFVTSSQGQMSTAALSTPTTPVVFDSFLERRPPSVATAPSLDANVQWPEEDGHPTLHPSESDPPYSSEVHVGPLPNEPAATSATTAGPPPHWCPPVVTLSTTTVVVEEETKETQETEEFFEEFWSPKSRSSTKRKASRRKKQNNSTESKRRHPQDRKGVGGGEGGNVKRLWSSSSDSSFYSSSSSRSSSSSIGKPRMGSTKPPSFRSAHSTEVEMRKCGNTSDNSVRLDVLQRRLLEQEEELERAALRQNEWLAANTLLDGLQLLLQVSRRISASVSEGLAPHSSVTKSECEQRNRTSAQSVARATMSAETRSYAAQPRNFIGWLCRGSVDDHLRENKEEGQEGLADVSASSVTRLSVAQEGSPALASRVSQRSPTPTITASRREIDAQFENNIDRTWTAPSRGEVRRMTSSTSTSFLQPPPPNPNPAAPPPLIPPQSDQLPPSSCLPIQVFISSSGNSSPATTVCVGTNDTRTECHSLPPNRATPSSTAVTLPERDAADGEGKERAAVAWAETNSSPDDVELLLRTDSPKKSKAVRARRLSSHQQRSPPCRHRCVETDRRERRDTLPTRSASHSTASTPEQWKRRHTTPRQRWQSSSSGRWNPPSPTEESQYHAAHQLLLSEEQRSRVLLVCDEAESMSQLQQQGSELRCWRARWRQQREVAQQEGAQRERIAQREEDSRSVLECAVRTSLRTALAPSTVQAQMTASTNVPMGGAIAQELAVQPLTYPTVSSTTLHMPASHWVVSEEQRSRSLLQQDMADSAAQLEWRRRELYRQQRQSSQRRSVVEEESVQRQRIQHREEDSRTVLECAVQTSMLSAVSSQNMHLLQVQLDHTETESDTRQSTSTHSVVLTPQHPSIRHRAVPPLSAEPFNVFSSLFSAQSSTPWVVSEEQRSRALLQQDWLDCLPALQQQRRLLRQRSEYETQRMHLIGQESMERRRITDREEDSRPMIECAVRTSLVRSALSAPLPYLHSTDSTEIPVFATERFECPELQSAGTQRRRQKGHMSYAVTTPLAGRRSGEPRSTEEAPPPASHWIFSEELRSRTLLQQAMSESASALQQRGCELGRMSLQVSHQRDLMEFESSQRQRITEREEDSRTVLECAVRTSLLTVAAVGADSSPPNDNPQFKDCAVAEPSASVLFFERGTPHEVVESPSVRYASASPTQWILAEEEHARSLVQRDAAESAVHLQHRSTALRQMNLHQSQRWELVNQEGSQRQYVVDREEDHRCTMKEVQRLWSPSEPFLAPLLASDETTNNKAKAPAPSPFLLREGTTLTAVTDSPTSNSSVPRTRTLMDESTQQGGLAHHQRALPTLLGQATQSSPSPSRSSSSSSRERLGSRVGEMESKQESIASYPQPQQTRHSTTNTERIEAGTCMISETEAALYRGLYERSVGTLHRGDERNDGEEEYGDEIDKAQRREFIPPLLSVCTEENEEDRQAEAHPIPSLTESQEEQCISRGGGRGAQEVRCGSRRPSPSHLCLSDLLPLYQATLWALRDEGSRRQRQRARRYMDYHHARRWRIYPRRVQSERPLRKPHYKKRRNSHSRRRRSLPLFSTSTSESTTSSSVSSTDGNDRPMTTPEQTKVTQAMESLLHNPTTCTQPRGTSPIQVLAQDAPQAKRLTRSTSPHRTLAPQPVGAGSSSYSFPTECTTTDMPPTISGATQGLLCERGVESNDCVNSTATTIPQILQPTEEEAGTATQPPPALISFPSTGLLAKEDETERHWPAQSLQASSITGTINTTHASATSVTSQETGAVAPTTTSVSSSTAVPRETIEEEEEQPAPELLLVRAVEEHDAQNDRGDDSQMLPLSPPTPQAAEHKLVGDPPVDEALLALRPAYWREHVVTPIALDRNYLTDFIAEQPHPSPSAAAAALEDADPLHTPEKTGLSGVDSVFVSVSSVSSFKSPPAETRDAQHQKTEETSAERRRHRRAQRDLGNHRRCAKSKFKSYDPYTHSASSSGGTTSSSFAFTTPDPSTGSSSKNGSLHDEKGKKKQQAKRRRANPVRQSSSPTTLTVTTTTTSMGPDVEPKAQDAGSSTPPLASSLLSNAVVPPRLTITLSAEEEECSHHTVHWSQSAPTRTSTGANPTIPMEGDEKNHQVSPLLRTAADASSAGAPPRTMQRTPTAILTSSSMSSKASSPPVTPRADVGGATSSPASGRSTSTTVTTLTTHSQSFSLQISSIESVHRFSFHNDARVQQGGRGDPTKRVDNANRSDLAVDAAFALLDAPEGQEQGGTHTPGVTSTNRPLPASQEQHASLSETPVACKAESQETGREDGVPPTNASTSLHSLGASSCPSGASSPMPSCAASPPPEPHAHPILRPLPMGEVGEPQRLDRASSPHEDLDRLVFGARSSLSPSPVTPPPHERSGTVPHNASPNPLSRHNSEEEEDEEAEQRQHPPLPTAPSPSSAAPVQGVKWDLPFPPRGSLTGDSSDSQGVSEATTSVAGRRQSERNRPRSLPHSRAATHGIPPHLRRAAARRLLRGTIQFQHLMGHPQAREEEPVQNRGDRRGERRYQDEEVVGRGEGVAFPRTQGPWYGDTSLGSTDPFTPRRTLSNSPSSSKTNARGDKTRSSPRQSSSSPVQRSDVTPLRSPLAGSTTMTLSPASPPPLSSSKNVQQQPGGRTTVHATPRGARRAEGESEEQQNSASLKPPPPTPQRPKTTLTKTIMKTPPPPPRKKKSSASSRTASGGSGHHPAPEMIVTPRGDIIYATRNAVESRTRLQEALERRKEVQRAGKTPSKSAPKGAAQLSTASRSRLDASAETKEEELEHVAESQGYAAALRRALETQFRTRRALFTSLEDPTEVTTSELRSRFTTGSSQPRPHRQRSSVTEDFSSVTAATPAAGRRTLSSRTRTRALADEGQTEDEHCGAESSAYDELDETHASVTQRRHRATAGHHPSPSRPLATPEKQQPDSKKGNGVSQGKTQDEEGELGGEDVDCRTQPDRTSGLTSSVWLPSPVPVPTSEGREGNKDRIETDPAIRKKEVSGQRRSIDRSAVAKVLYPTDSSTSTSWKPPTAVRRTDTHIRSRPLLLRAASASSATAPHSSQPPAAPRSRTLSRTPPTVLRRTGGGGVAAVHTSYSTQLAEAKQRFYQQQQPRSSGGANPSPTVAPRSALLRQPSAHPALATPVSASGVPTESESPKPPLPRREKAYHAQHTAEWNGSVTRRPRAEGKLSPRQYSATPASAESPSPDTPALFTTPSSHPPRSLRAPPTVTHLSHVLLASTPQALHGGTPSDTSFSPFSRSANPRADPHRMHPSASADTNTSRTGAEFSRMTTTLPLSLSDVPHHQQLTTSFLLSADWRFQRQFVESLFRATPPPSPQHPTAGPDDGAAGFLVGAALQQEPEHASVRAVMGSGSNPSVLRPISPTDRQKDETEAKKNS